MQPVRDGLGVEGGDDGLRKQPGQQTGAGLRVFVEMQEILEIGARHFRRRFRLSCRTAMPGL